MDNDIVTLFCDVDDFCIIYEPQFNKWLLQDGSKKRIRKSKLILSEVMTITIWFHASGYRTFKDYYKKEVIPHLQWAFHDLVSYNRFVELMSQALLPLFGCCIFIPHIYAIMYKYITPLYHTVHLLSTFFIDVFVHSW